MIYVPTFTFLNVLVSPAASNDEIDARRSQRFFPPRTIQSLETVPQELCRHRRVKDMRIATASTVVHLYCLKDKHRFMEVTLSTSSKT